MAIALTLSAGAGWAASVIPVESHCEFGCTLPALEGTETLAGDPTITQDMDPEANPLRKYAPIQKFLQEFGPASAAGPKEPLAPAASKGAAE